jgi:hypothetical protein
MLWFKKREGDIEMEAMRGQKKDTTPDDTEYRSINWKKIMLSPKYIRTASLSQHHVDPLADKRFSLAHSQYPDLDRNCAYHDKTR